MPSTVADAAQRDLVLIAVGWKHIADAVGGVRDWQNRIVIDATNPILTPGFAVADLGGRTSSEFVADRLPGARLVKAFNMLRPNQLGADPRDAGGRRVIVYAVMT